MGGCQTGSLNLIWGGNYVDSGIGLAIRTNGPEDPTSWVNLYLDLNEYNDTCKALISKDLEFDLKKVRIGGEKRIGMNFFVSSRDKVPTYSLVHSYREEISNNTGICPADLKTCPDGRLVGRELPNCEFEKCPSDEECEVVGLRKDGKYCSLDKVFILQKPADSSCDNNFECSSNVCVSSKCVSPSLIDKIINWFKRLFGFD